MIIYRAMCKVEYEETLKLGKPHFHSRFKWFSPNLSWITERVQGGNFNNSRYLPDRYKYVLSFEWDGTNDDFTSENEIQFDRRRNPNIKLTDSYGH